MPENEDVNQDARPQAPAAPEQPARPQAPPTEPGQSAGVGHDGHDELSSDKAMLILANAMPWVISMLFHLGLFLVMFFLVFMVVKQPDSEEIIIPDAVMSDNPGGMVNPRQSQTKSKSQTRQKRKKFTRKTKISVDTGKTKTALKVFGGASAAATDDMGLRANTGTRSSFYGSGGNAHNPSTMGSSRKCLGLLAGSNPSRHSISSCLHPVQLWKNSPLGLWLRLSKTNAPPRGSCKTFPPPENPAALYPP